MYLITVIPIGRGMGKETLTYFTIQDIAKGSVVTVPLRNKTAQGLVIDSTSARENKSEIKSLAYSIKKIDAVESSFLVSPEFIAASRKIADYYACTVGAVLSVLIPKEILEASNTLSYSPLQNHDAHNFHETLLLQTDTENRYSTYKSLIREEFAKGHSVFFCLSTIEDIKNIQKILEKGIEKYTHILHSGISKKDIVPRWQHAMDETHPVLIIGTGGFLSLPRTDIRTIILEKESSRAFGTLGRPYLDMRTVSKILAEQSRQKLVLGDTLLRIETLWKEKSGTYIPLTPLSFRSVVENTGRVVNMRQPEDQQKKEFAIFSQEVIDMVGRAIENNEKTFLFCSRKGLYPSTVCSDCGTIVSCVRCKNPVVLYKNKGVNIFVCHHCGERRPADTLCMQCGGWRLTTLGIGTDRVAEEIQLLFPRQNVIIMDKDHIKTHSQAVKARDMWYDTPGCILVGTEMAISYLNQKIENVAVISLDALFSIPDFRIHEKIFHILLDLRHITTQKILVQTRQKGTSLLDQALSGNLIDFYREEVEERKMLDYPPFTTLIKLTATGTKPVVQEKMNEVVTLLAPYVVSLFPAFKQGEKYTLHGLISLPHGSWVDRELLAKLVVIPPHISIKIDPDTLL